MKLNQFRRFPGERGADPHTNKRTQRDRRANRYSFFIIIWSCIAILGGASVTAAGPHTTGWIQLCPPISPPPRSYLAMTYDPASGKVIMFGGSDGATYLNDTWTFDGITWAQVTTLPSPPARTNAQIAYDAVTESSALRRIQRQKLFGRYLALGWHRFPMDAGQTYAFSNGCHRSYALHRPERQRRHIWRIRWAFLPGHHVAMEWF